MKTHLGRMEAFDALLESRFEPSSTRPKAPSEDDEDAEQGASETPAGEGGRESPPAMPPAAGRGPAHRAAHLGESQTSGLAF